MEIELRLLSKPSSGRARGVVGRWWNRSRSRRLLMEKVERRRRTEIRLLGAGAVLTQNGEASGLERNPEGLHVPPVALCLYRMWELTGLLNGVCLSELTRFPPAVNGGTPSLN